VERHDTLLIFQKYYSAVVSTLEELVDFPDRNTSDKARAHLNSLTTPVFLISLGCLQTVNRDLVDAVDGITFVKNTLESWRSSEDEWHDEEYGPFPVAKKLAESVDMEITMPRMAVRQRNRNNMPAEYADEYFRRAVWYTYLDAVIEAIRSRFTPHSTLINKMVALIPAQVSHFQWKDVKESIQLYLELLGNPDEEEVKLQYLEWKAFCTGLAGQPPATPLEALDVVPNRLVHIKKLLIIFSTIPVTSCSAERAFSAMRILKNYLRSRMKDDRLTGLALMYIHPETHIDVDKVIDRFATTKKRRLDFAL
jgi:hypothetical protein